MVIWNLPLRQFGGIKTPLTSLHSALPIVRKFLVQRDQIIKTPSAAFEVVNESVLWQVQLERYDVINEARSAEILRCHWPDTGSRKLAF
eukprot:1376916-Amphidinium_carterae.1